MLTAVGGAIAQVPSQAPAAAASGTPEARRADAEKTQGLHEYQMDKKIKAEKSPDAALIEFLGEYGDTADGLDPMGVADPEAPPDKSGDGKK